MNCHLLRADGGDSPILHSVGLTGQFKEEGILKLCQACAGLLAINSFTLLRADGKSSLLLGHDVFCSSVVTLEDSDLS